MLDYSFARPVAVPALQALFKQTEWAKDRTDEEVGALIANTSVQLGVWQEDRLVAYARAITVSRFRALVDDVVVDQGQRGSGIGTEMMRQLVARLDPVDEIFLLSGERNVSYYQRLGFLPSAAICMKWPKSRKES